jgi:hypothetical protein
MSPGDSLLIPVRIDMRDDMILGPIFSFTRARLLNSANGVVAEVTVRQPSQTNVVPLTALEHVRPEVGC